MTFDEIKATFDKYMMHAYSPYQLCAVSGKNATLTDIDGKQYIDFTSGIGVNCLGIADNDWADAISEQAHTLNHISNLYINPVTVTLAKTLCQSSGFDKVFFGNSGAEANECAIKLARKYSFDKYGEGRNEIITLKNSFHGRTITTLSATGQDVFHNFFFPFTEGFTYVTAGDADELKNAVTDKTCAIMVELIQGEGGLIPLNQEYVEFVRALCDEKDLVFIADEVQTGVGRTGKLYAWENFGVKPDVLTSSKGLGGGIPIGACLCTEKFAGVINPGQHGTTFGGNPICCAAANKVLSVITADGFLDVVCKKAEYMRSELAKIEGIKNVRGIGLMIGADVDGIAASDLVKKALENGLMLLTAKTSLRFLPPLTITYNEIDRGISILKNILEGK